MDRSKGTENLSVTLQELARLGSPVDLSVADLDRENKKVDITQVGGVCESSLFELPDGRVAYRMALRITNLTSRTIYSVELELRAPGADGLFDWLMPLDIPVRNKKRNSSYRAYRFPGGSGLELEYDQVLNHVLLECGTLPPQRPLEGWLLAVGGLMPAELRHGQLLDVTLAIIGSDGAEHAENIHLWTERLRLKSTERPPREEENSQPQSLWAPGPSETVAVKPSKAPAPVVCISVGNRPERRVK